MAIELQETFRVHAPIDKVWEFLLTPENIVTCLPGATLIELIDDKKFEGSVKVKIGAITAKYAGTITYTITDVSDRKVVMLAQAKEKGGGTVTGTITTELVAISENETEACSQSSVDMTGRIVSVGRGMIEGVAAQIIGTFIKNVKTLLEFEAAPIAATEDGANADAAPRPAPVLVDREDEINVLAVVWKVIRDAIVSFFKRLVGAGGK